MSASAATASRDLRGPALAVAAGILFGIVVIVGKPALDGNAPFSLLAWRFGGTCLGLTVVAIATRRPLRLAPGEGLPILAAGFFGYGVEASLFFAALNHGSAAAVTLLFYTYPVYTMLIALLTKRLPHGRSLWLALVMAMAGVAVLVAGGESISIEAVGVVLALCCALAFTLYLTVTDHALRRSNPLTAGIWLSGGASAFCFVAAFVSGTFDVPSGWDRWAPIVAMALATSGAFVCMLAAIQRIGAVRTAIICVFEAPVGRAAGCDLARRAAVPHDRRGRGADPAGGGHRDEGPRRTRGRARPVSPAVA